MRPRTIFTLFALLLGVVHSAAAQRASETLRLARLFGDGMVLQRSQPVVVWGWALPRTSVTVALRGKSAKTVSDSAGAWKLTLPSQPAGGPVELTVAAGSTRIVLHDVLVGDVWVASGQSNMEFTVSGARDAAREIASANDPAIRHFKVPASYASTPEADLAGGSWARADSEHVGAFSAVAYFFARELRKTVHVPIGIINTSWGGSAIESWMSQTAHGFSDSAWAAIQRAENARMEASHDALRARIGDVPATDPGLVNGNAVWADPALEDSAWTAMPVPAYWEQNGFPGMDGVGWYRFTFTLGDADARDGLTLSMSAIDDDDITWVNGVEVGRTQGYNVARRYAIPPSALHAGTNVLAVRVSDGGGGGGINGAVSLASATGTRSLAGRWKFKVGEVSFRPDGQQINKVPTVLYNKMLHPLVTFPIRGALWYQGESNANTVQQAAAYRGQFATLIKSWRGEWASANVALSVAKGLHLASFPFLWVQLPNFGAADSVPPATSAWATQRESMTSALSLANTGQAIAIDVGEAGDIHPKNKQDVGKRLALVARRVAYDQRVVASGPTYRSHVVRDGKVIVSFHYVGRGLESRSPDGSVGGFAIAGADRRWTWANARITGTRVEVWSDAVSNPVAVRYAWANNPEKANLYNHDGLPAAPFRTDQW